MGAAANLTGKDERTGQNCCGLFIAARPPVEVALGLSMTITSSSNAQTRSPEVFMFPASHGQKRLWFNDQRNPGRSIYNVFDTVRVVGPLDLDAFNRSVREVVRRHESLRTHFTAVEGEPQQVIDATLEIEVPIIDLTSEPQEKREEIALRLLCQF